MFVLVSCFLGICFELRFCDAFWLTAGVHDLQKNVDFQESDMPKSRKILRKSYMFAFLIEMGLLLIFRIVLERIRP
jgi:hypothetical protein